MSKLSAVAAFCAAGDKSGTVTPARLAKVPAHLLLAHTAARETPELYTAPLPTRRADGSLAFADAPAFRPTLTPEQVLRGGAWGGGYFRAIASGVTGRVHEGAWRELPQAWLAGLSVPTRLAAPAYNAAVNRFGVRSGQDLRDWEGSAWITAQDPFGWFQWYCRYFQGRRSADDGRQLARWGALAGAKGRWKRNLIAKVAAAGRAFDDASVSPVVRQTLWHWAYDLSQADYEAYAKSLKGGARAPYLKGQPAPAAKAGSSSASSSSSAQGAGGGGASGSAAAGGGRKRRGGAAASGSEAAASGSRKRGGGAAASGSEAQGGASSSASAPSKRRKRGE